MSYSIVSTLDKFGAISANICVPSTRGTANAIAIAFVGGSNSSPKSVSISISDVVSSVSLKINGTYIANAGVTPSNIRIVLPIEGQESIFTAANVAFSSVPTSLLPSTSFKSSYLVFDDQSAPTQLETAIVSYSVSNPGVFTISKRNDSAFTADVTKVLTGSIQYLN